MSISTILDPRFKKLHFEKALLAANAISRIESLLQRNKIRRNMTEKLNAGMVEKDCDNLWSFHEHLVSKNNTNEDLSELRQYLSQPVIERKSNPLQYWKSVKHTFPMLYEQAIKYVSVLGTSVPSERIFSQAGDIKTDERSRLTGEHLNMLFLGSLAFDDWGLE
ncbi:zinc finger BED domain-containing protein 4-like [Temnothorax curvispinosus]|uniref:Zinc finger BED domain-containing protein 4-like n=1 Tax=Temnothorax curvispinosus TaxID=300111 RepID=A0A6J1R390_9HYME|nr:zinc finger BED domain-containing protein 4-like [Temnothorax curvispinosus]